MKDIDNIEDWYRDELNNYNVEPDKNLWDSLSGELDSDAPLTDENISEWYKKEVTKLEERPDYTVWEKLSTRLDTATVWDKLSMSLNRYDQIIWWRNLAFRGTAVFLLLLGSYLAYNNYANDDNNAIVEETGVNDSNNAIKNNNGNGVINDKLIKNGTTYEAAYGVPVVQDENESNLANNPSDSKRIDGSGTNELNESFASANENNEANLSPEAKVNISVEEARQKVIAERLAKNRGRSKESGSYASLRKIENHYSSIYIDKLDELKSETEKDINRDIDRHTLTERDISHMYSSSDFLVKKDNNKIVFNSKRFSSYFIYGVYARRIYVGFNAGIKKQGMLTKFKENSPLADYKQSDFIDLGTNFGGVVGFIVSDNFNVEANLNVNSTSGYKRAFDAEGISYKENMNLNYTSISLLAKKMNNKSTFDNKVYSTNLIGGVYASYLRSATSDVNGVSQSLDGYNKADFGIVLGIEQDRYITKTFVITPGVRYNQGLLDIANENSAFEAARNFSFEFNLGVKYIFLKKGKK